MWLSMGMGKFLSVDECHELLRVSRSTFRKVRKAKNFPAPVPVASRRIVFSRAEVLTWCQQRQAAADLSAMLCEDESK